MQYKTRIFYVIILTLVTVGGTDAQMSTDLSALSLKQPEFIHQLMNGRFETFQEYGLDRLYYTLGVYIQGMANCPKLKTTNFPITDLNHFHDPVYFLGTMVKNVQAVNPYQMYGIMPIINNYRSEGKGRGDIQAIIDTFGCNAPETRTVVGAVETIIVDYLEERKKLEEAQVRHNSYKKRIAEEDAEYKRQVIAGNSVLMNEYNKEVKECQQKAKNNAEINECIIEPKKRYHKAYAYLQNFTYNSGLIRSVYHSIEGIGSTWATIELCNNVQDSTIRAEVEDLLVRYFKYNGTRMIEKYDAAYFKQYLIIYDIIEKSGRVSVCDKKSLKEAKALIEKSIKSIESLVNSYLDMK